MNIDFYTPADHTMKMRRNLLIAGALCFMHYEIMSLSLFKPSGISVPKEFIDWALPACVLWFALNYFYYLFAEFTQWRASIMVAATVPATNGTLAQMTLVGEVAHFSEANISVKLSFDGSINLPTEAPQSPSSAPLEKIILNRVEQLNARMTGEIVELIKADLVRISAFQNAMLPYNAANRLRFCVLDIGVPAIISLVAAVLTIQKYF